MLELELTPLRVFNFSSHFPVVLGREWPKN